MCLCLAESEVSPVEQTLGSLAMDAVTLLLTANNSNAGKWTSWPTVDTGDLLVVTVTSYSAGIQTSHPAVNTADWLTPVSLPLSLTVVNVVQVHH